MNKLLFYVPLFVFSLICSGKLCTAQLKITSIGAGTNYLPASRYIRPEDSVKTDSKSTQQQIWMAAGFSLINQLDSTTGKARILSGNLRGHYTTFNHNHYSKNIFPDQLLATDFGLQYFQSLRNRWSYTLFGSVGLNSDLNHVSGKDIFASGGIIFIKTFTPTFSFGFGLMAHNSFGDVLPWPVLMVRWQIGNRYKLQINVPDNGIGLAYNVGVSYATSVRNNLTLAFRPRMISYDVERNPENTRLASYWELPIGLESRWQFSRIELFAGGGLMALRSVQYGEKNISKMFTKYPAHRLSANLYLNTGVHIRL